MQIKKALITAGGYGTRFLPVTKTIQKEMLPILNRPLVDYVVEDCIKAGVEEIIFVINERDTQIQGYYSENKYLYQYLERMGKVEKYDVVADLHSKAKFTFIVQPDDAPYGTATPVKLAQGALQDEAAFFVFTGDDFVYHADGSSEAKRMLQTFASDPKAAALTTFWPRPENLLHKYGVAITFSEGNKTYLKGIVEKPEPGTAPSNLANISRYILTAQVFSVLATQKPDQRSGELFLTDTLTQLAAQAPVLVHSADGEYLDGGFVAAWLKANLRLAYDNPELKADVDEFIREFWLK